MVRAILDGRKTMTRRIVKPQPVIEVKTIYTAKDGCFEITRGGARRHIFTTPFRPGQTLWVRETFKDVSAFLGWDKVGGKCPEGCGAITYRADGEIRQYSILLKEPERLNLSDIPAAEKLSWKPSIHMPRWASRITLEVTGVRVERVQEISDSDVHAEGIPDSLVEEWRRWLHPNDAPGHAFGVFWDLLNAKRGYLWGSNPWVWIVEFKRVTG
jgi:hypothetical protein